MATEFLIRWRPKKWEQIVGHDTVVKAVRASLEEGRSSAFLFTGEPGTGKTTFARVIARHVGADPDTGNGYSEYDGATNTGVDDTRAIMQRARLKPLGIKDGRQVVVIDECHFLSKNAWNSLLKIVEEPPKGLVWVFCTSEGTKVPASIRSRCQEFHLETLTDKQITGLLESAVDRGKLDISEEAFDLVVDAAQGVPRNALVGLGKIIGLGNDLDAISSVLAGVATQDTAEVIDFCRDMAKGSTDFRGMAKKVLDLQGKITAEGVRNVVNSYFAKACVGNQWERAVAVLTGFSTPYPAGIGDSMVPVLVSLASVLKD